MVDMLTHHRLHAMENGPLGSSPMRSRPNGDQPSSRVPQHRLEENRPPPAISKALSSMLKTTTETGDIGMFSIKPPRVPHAPGSPRRVNGLYRDNRPQNAQRPPNFEPYGGNAGVIDDRRRLPSYSRDVTSEVVSLYETASQKSVNRVYDDPDYRSYSMNQTYSQYALTNHRSYSSLRSQPDGGSQGQRPRSPFAYPARLKRHGFRPSSPALTDGGLVDYSRRAEIERGPHVSSSSRGLLTSMGFVLNQGMCLLIQHRSLVLLLLHLYMLKDGYMVRLHFVQMQTDLPTLFLVNHHQYDDLLVHWLAQMMVHLPPTGYAGTGQFL